MGLIFGIYLISRFHLKNYILYMFLMCSYGICDHEDKVILAVVQLPFTSNPQEGLV